jgi:hypothetical protein
MSKPLSFGFASTSWNYGSFYKMDTYKSRIELNNSKKDTKKGKFMIWNKDTFNKMNKGKQIIKANTLFSSIYGRRLFLIISSKETIQSKKWN